MTTHRLSILGANTTPDTSGNVFMEPYPIKATNDFWKHSNFIFLDTATKDSLYSLFEVPMNYVSNPKFYVVWTTTAVSGNAIWTMDYRDVTGGDTASLDQTTAQESLTVTTAAPSATDRRIISSMTATAGNFTQGDTVEFFVSRNGAGSDTIAASLSLFDVIFEYTDI